MSGEVAESWRWVVGYEGLYEVSDLGNLRRGGEQRKVSKNYAGYRVVTLSKSGTRKQHRLHCLVLEAFVGPRPEGFQGCHHDDDKENNRLENLAWKSVGDNHRDRSANGRTACGDRHGRYKQGKFVGQHRRYYTNKHVK